MSFLRKLLGHSTKPSEPEPNSDPTPCEPPMAAHHTQVGWATDRGLLRDHNEDALVVMEINYSGDYPVPSLGIFVVADGMGGHELGEVASSLAARVVAHYLAQHVCLPVLLGKERDAQQRALHDILVDAVNQANLEVADQVPDGGTTLSAALMLGQRAYVAHVGDSRVYILGESRIQQITHDHSLVDRLVELGQLTPDEAAVHPQRNVLYRVVGQSGPLEVDTYVRTVPAGSSLLLCSDGLWGLVPDDRMLEIVRKAPSPQAACEQLVEAANQAGGPDNITVVLVKPPQRPAQPGVTAPLPPLPPQEGEFPSGAAQSPGEQDES